MMGSQGIVTIVGLCHTIGCFWWYLGTHPSRDNTNLPDNWIAAAEHEGLKARSSTILDDYILSVYWACITLLTVGYFSLNMRISPNLLI